jgi:hypothetical protein
MSSTRSKISGSLLLTGELLRPCIGESSGGVRTSMDRRRAASPFAVRQQFIATDRQGRPWSSMLSPSL